MRFHEFDKENRRSVVYHTGAYPLPPNKNILIPQPNHMLWALKRCVSMRRFFWAPKTYVQTDGLENIYNFTLKNFVYLNLWYKQIVKVDY